MISHANPRIRTLRRAALMALMLFLPPVTVVSAASSDIQLGASCITAECHGDVQSMDFLHGPVNLKQCEPCHIPIGNKHEFEAAATGSALCLTCHEVGREMPVVHGPFESDCTLCHGPHGGNNRGFLKGGEGAESCRLCHDIVTQDMTHLHGPVALGECLACHSPHQSEHEFLLVEPPRQLCLGCHIDVEASMNDAIVVHEPVTQSCSGCHDAHGGPAEFLLHGEGSELCMNCHGDFIEEAGKVAFPHKPMAEGKSCRNCHAPHASTQQGLLATKTADLCLSCHNEEIEGSDRTIDNVAQDIKQAAFVHGPIREGNCVACHKPHGSDVASILREPYPREFYAAYKEGAYDLCFECHDRTLVLDAESNLTGFRNGTQNLHFLHVNREKGRTCRACHAEHAASQPNHVRSEVPFGRWMMKVDFTKRESGGTCETGCHVPYTYDRVTPHQNTDAE